LTAAYIPARGIRGGVMTHIQQLCSKNTDFYMTCRNYKNEDKLRAFSAEKVEFHDIHRQIEMQQHIVVPPVGWYHNGTAQLEAACHHSSPEKIMSFLFL